MAKKNPAAVPVQKFFGKYHAAIKKGHAAEERQRSIATVAGLVELIEKGEYEAPRWITSGEMWDEVRGWWPVRLLREAADEDDSEGFKRILHYFLTSLDVSPPKGVLIPFRWKRGRPNETEGIYEAWIAKGRPSLTWRVCEDLAKTFNGDEFAHAKSNPILRRKTRNRVRAAILRHQLVATKPARVS